MSLGTFHDKVRNLGLGAMYEKHWAYGFRDLFDPASPEWASTAVTQKVIDLKAFTSAGLSVEEIINHYRETVAGEGGGHGLEGLPLAMRAYRQAGYWPPLPDDLDAAVNGLVEAEDSAATRTSLH
ncbi:MAG TPA: hypothetical protein VFB66_27410 [Tepidisphaeraceae bacterium]|nr:hypothetical protein [Tepidisphaeraceae bacterium]